MAEDVYTWNDGEVVYCAGLIALRGVPAVPKHAIPSYFASIIAGAAKDKRDDVVKELKELLAIFMVTTLMEVVEEVHEAEETHDAPQAN